MILKVKVKPGSKEKRIEKIADNEYNVSLRERAEDGKANRRLIAILAKGFKVDWRTIKIKNPSSRSKIVEIKK